MTMALMLALSSLAQAQFFSKKTRDLLPEDEAFAVTAMVEDGLLRVNWSIAQDYYMYRDQFSISSNTAGVTIGEITFPSGKIEEDPEFGQVEVYFFNVELTAPIETATSEVQLLVRGQGCNKPVGVCYPPQARTIDVSVDTSSSSANAIALNSTPQNTPPLDTAATQNKSFWAYVIAALGAGVLLSFTPCVLPMIPILAGVIAGQQNPSKLRSGWLAICYVLGTIVTYAVAGWVAGASGTQLQAHFQNPWVLGAICALLLVLVCSLFGFFKIQLPSSLQTKLNGSDVNGRSASLSSFVLGLISALVVGACVSPVLILTLGAAITQGDPVLGAAIMAAMASGMGILLILFGFGAGWILPKTGAWMNQIQVLFGFMVLGVAIYIASSIDGVPTLYLWAVLLLWSGHYLWRFGSEIVAPMMRSALEAAGLAIMLWGGLALIGAGSGGDDVLQPLSSLNLSAGSNTQKGGGALPFNSVTTLAEAQTLLVKAKTAGRPALIDFYADWCLDCKRMHRTTFKEASVAQALESWDLIEIDVTDTSDASEEVKKFFNVFGPPATLYISADGQEFENLRQYGYMKTDDFLAILSQAK